MDIAVPIIGFLCITAIILARMGMDYCLKMEKIKRGYPLKDEPKGPMAEVNDAMDYRHANN